MGASPGLVVAFVFALLLKERILIHSGQLGSLALWGVWQLVQQISGWVQAGPFLQVGMVQGWSLVLWASAQMAQWEGFLHRAPGCP